MNEKLHDDIVNTHTGEVVYKIGEPITNELLLAAEKLEETDLHEPSGEARLALDALHIIASMRRARGALA